MDKVAFKSFVLPFYQKTLGFWTLVLLVGGVFMELKQHILLGKFLFRNPLAFWILPFSFLVFSLFHWNFLTALFRKKDYQLFHQLGLFPSVDFRRFWVPVILANQGAFLCYFLFLSYFGLEQHALGRFITLWFVILGSLILQFRGIYSLLKKPMEELSIYRPKVSWKLSRFTWISLHLRQTRPILLLLTKGLSLLLLNGFFYSFLGGGYDFRWLEFGVLIVAFLQIPLLMEKADFENQTQTWLLGIPRSFLSKLRDHMAGLAIILLPELIFLTWKGILYLPWSNTLELLGLLLANLSILLVFTYQKHANPSFLKWLAGTFFILFLLLIFNFPSNLIIFAGLLLLGLQVKSPYHI